MPKSKKAKIRDKWRSKKWVTVEAPPSFGSTVLAQVPITDESKTLGRVIETTLFDIVKQDPQQYSIKLFFQIDQISGERATTIFKGHEYSREYLRSLIRRGSSMVNHIGDYKTKDDYVVRAYVVVLTQGRLNSSRKHAVRDLAHKILQEKADNFSYDQFAQEAVLGKIASDIYNVVKKVSHLRHVGVKKTKLVKRPSTPQEAPLSKGEEVEAGQPPVAT